MKLNSLIPMILTPELTETVNFYTGVLGFDCKELNEEKGWATLIHDNIQLMVAAPSKQIAFNNPAFTGSFYFYPDNVDILWDSIKRKAKVCYPIDNFDHGMREFAIYDNNGYLLQFGQKLLDYQTTNN